MCGRLVLGIPFKQFMEFFNIAGIEEREEFFRYNLAPTDTIAGIVRDADTGERQARWFRWGLVPGWSKDPKIGAKMFNARAETLGEKPSFREAFRKRRCLIPAQGFYEWEHHGNSRAPWFIHRRDDDPMAFAGLWEHWRRGSEEIASCAIVTTAADAVVGPLHNRMPVILDPLSWDNWLNPATNTAALTALLSPPPPDTLVRYRVSNAVNSVKHDGADCIVPVSM